MTVLFETFSQLFLIARLAKAKLSEARSFALMNELYDDYQEFFNANSSMIISSCG